MIKVLQGIRIVEQGTFITGPCAGMILADLGADVIKVESPGEGDPYRNFRNGLYSAHFQAYNRNKRSLALDLKKETDRAVMRGLVASADVYIQNFRPGAAERMGMDWRSLSGINQRLVYCSISGFGQTGPYIHRPSYDSVTQALSGFLGVAIDFDQPRLLGPAMADAITGLYAAMGIMGALVERGRTGIGRHLEISMLEAMMHFAIEPFTGYFALGDVPKSVDRPKLAQAFVLRCADDKLLAIHLSSIEKFWDNLVLAIDGQALAVDPRFATRLLRIDNYSALLDALNAVVGKHPRDHWLARMANHDLPFAPVNSIPEAADDDQAKHLGMIVPVEGRKEGAELAVRPAFVFDGQRAGSVKAAPLLDENGGEIRTALADRPGEWPAADIATRENRHVYGEGTVTVDGR
jgi:crotonobetainyl-CoA:carnitine CoA-transferase CaiB-like acyl-CoA transferase